MTTKLKHYFGEAFPAFRYRNYRIYFTAQIIALTGTWMQTVAQGYLVYQLTHSAFLVGVVAALGNLPTTFFALIGGTLVDRFPRRNLLRITQACQFVLASSLGILIITDHINVPILAAGAFLMGMVNAIDQPARLSNVAFLVHKDHIHAAQAMNMATFNSARIIGPAIAGWLIYAFGIGWAFVINGLSFIAPFIAYNFIDFGSHIPKPHQGTWHAIKEGLNYVAHHKLIKTLLLYMVIISIFGWAYTTMLPVIADRVFHKDAQGLGMLFAAAGAGSVLGALVASAYTSRFNPSKTMLLGGITFAISLFVFTQTANFTIALIALFFSGFGMITQNSTIQASIQKSADDHIRGRVASLQTLAFVGMTPLGALQIGFVSEHFGPQIAVMVGAIVIFFAAIFLYFKSPLANFDKS